jgi:hypothetical protein
MIRRRKNGLSSCTQRGWNNLLNFISTGIYSVTVGVESATDCCGGCSHSSSNSHHHLASAGMGGSGGSGGGGLLVAESGVNSVLLAGGSSGSAVAAAASIAGGGAGNVGGMHNPRYDHHTHSRGVASNINHQSHTYHEHWGIPNATGAGAASSRVSEYIDMEESLEQSSEMTPMLYSNDK